MNTTKPFIFIETNDLVIGTIKKPKLIIQWSIIVEATDWDVFLRDREIYDLLTSKPHTLFVDETLLEGKKKAIANLLDKRWKKIRWQIHTT